MRRTSGGGQRWLHIDRTATYDEMLQKLKHEFGITDLSARLGLYNGTPFPKDQTFGEYLKRNKPASYPKVYIITSEP